MKGLGVEEDEDDVDVDVEYKAGDIYDINDEDIQILQNIFAMNRVNYYEKSLKRYAICSN